MFLALATVVSGVAASDITLWNAETGINWHETNDPVMGGKSTGSFKIDQGLLKFKGQVVDVPKLQAPGFIKIESGGATQWWSRYFSAGNNDFADVSSCKALVIKAKANAGYDGYRFSFGSKRSTCSFFSSGFKTHFVVPADGKFHEVKMPFNAFSNCNSDSTGEPTKTCAEHEEVCPHASDLKDVHPLSIWGEGKAGTVDLEVESIVATGCSQSVASDIIVAHGRSLRSPKRKLLARRRMNECSSGQNRYIRIDNDLCSQTCLGSKLGFCPTSLVAKMGQLKLGECADGGFTVEASQTKQKAGPCGSIDFTAYTRDLIAVHE